MTKWQQWDLRQFFHNKVFVNVLMVPSWADQLLLQLLVEQFDTLPIQCRHIEHLLEGVSFRKNNFWQNDSCENLDNFSLIRLLNMHRWCLHWPINSYYSFWWSNLILCLYNVDTLNICTKEFSFLMVPSWADQLLLQLLVEQFDTLPIQCRHIEHLLEGVWFRKINFDKMTAVRT